MPLRRRSEQRQARSDHQTPLESEATLERTTGFEPATLTLARLG